MVKHFDATFDEFRTIGGHMGFELELEPERDELRARLGRYFH